MSAPVSPSATEKISFLRALLGKQELPDISVVMAQWAVHNELGPMAYFRYNETADAASKKILRQAYMNSAVMDMKFCAAYAEIKKIFDEAQIDYVPLKGMGLVRQGIYQNGALRQHCDIDLLLRTPEECVRASQLLQDMQWRFAGDINNYHHLPPLFKNGIMLEIHHLLPGVRSSEVTAHFWNVDFARQDGSCEYWLSAEMHWAVLFAHIAINHDWDNGAKFLADAGMLMKSSGFDREKCFSYCRKMGISMPENLLTAFPEIFDTEGDIARFAVLRDYVLSDKTPVEVLLMNCGKPGSWRWWRKRLGGFRLSWLRQKYNLPDASRWQMLNVMRKDYWRKICKGFKYMFAFSSAEKRVQTSKLTSELLGIGAENEVFKHI